MARILCIEDENFIREDIVEELEDAGHEVVQADCGTDGLEAILANKLDLVLCDISMPAMDGHALLTELRTNYPAFNDLPFVFLSALGDRKDVIAGKQLGADDYLTKPIDFELLHATVASRLRQIDRMTERKELQMVRLYKALSECDAPAGQDAHCPESGQTDQSGEGNPNALHVTVVGAREEASSAAAGLRQEGHIVSILPDVKALLSDSNTETSDLVLVTAAASLRNPELMARVAGLDCPKILLMPQPADDADNCEAVPGFDAILNWRGDSRMLDAEISTVAGAFEAANKIAS